MADCRRCIYFLNKRQMTPSERDQAVRWIAEHRPSHQLLGYCSFYDRPVTYYRGKCSGFQEKPELKPKKITEFLVPQG